ncbi:MAG: pentapeptide repeat-containing protein [Clostridia bacterium]|nr:pentapeptide repeat-containing protein [Clostridia bacterium]
MFNDVFLKHKEWIATAGKSGEQACFDEADMHKVPLNKPILEQGYYSLCDFNGIQFTDVDFYLSEFYSCDFKNAVFKDCDFRKTTLDYSDFSKSVFINCKFSRADAFKTVFRECSFKGCSFVGINLMETNMEKATFENTDFDEAYIDKSIMSDAVFIDPENINKLNHISIVEKDGIVYSDAEAIARLLQNR